MDPKWQTLFYILAIAVWLFAAYGPRGTPARVGALRLVAFGLALFAMPSAWGAAAAGW